VPGAALSHRRQHRLDHGDRAEYVDLELPPQVVDRGFLQKAFVAIAGIVHQHVDGADIFLDRRDRGRDLRGVGDVKDHRVGALTEFLEIRFVAFLAHGAHDDMTVAQRRLGQCPAESGGNAGDEKCLCICLRHGRCLSRLNASNWKIGDLD